jgi:hypothetical protein
MSKSVPPIRIRAATVRTTITNVFAILALAVLTAGTACAATADPAFDPDYSIRSLMNTLIQPNADTLWRAVRYVVSEDGVQEDIEPTTDADWEQLRRSAVDLMAAGNALLLPGRVVATTPADAAYKYEPDEIRELLAASPGNWRFYIQQLQTTTQATLEAIENRSVDGLVDTGASINSACQGCHAEYWYRPPR